MTRPLHCLSQFTYFDPQPEWTLPPVPAELKTIALDFQHAQQLKVMCAATVQHARRVAPHQNQTKVTTDGGVSELAFPSNNPDSPIRRAAIDKTRHRRLQVATVGLREDAAPFMSSQHHKCWVHRASV